MQSRGAPFVVEHGAARCAGIAELMRGFRLMRSIAPASGREAAAWSTMRADRRFLWLWLVIATALSVGGNVGHAWLTVDAGVSRGMAIGWAVAPPTLLMLAIHGLPTLARMLGSEDRDGMLTFVVWGVTLGAFGWSAVGIVGFTTAMGVPTPVAWVAPLVIDLSVFGATRGLVLTAPLAARMRAEMQAAPAVAALADAVESSAEGEVGCVIETTSTPVDLTHSGGPGAADDGAAAQSASPVVDSVRGLAAPARQVAMLGQCPRCFRGHGIGRTDRRRGCSAQACETVAAILAAAEGETRKAIIAERTGVHHSVVTKTLEAAAAYRGRPLAVAG